MSVIAWPDLKVSSFRWNLREQTVPFKSGFGSQALVLGVPTWSVEMSGVPEYWREVEQITAFIESLRGYANQLSLHHLTNKTPRGSLRGFPALHSEAPAGSTALEINAGLEWVGATLHRGDLLGIGANITRQVVRVMADAVVDELGVIQVKLNVPLRNRFEAGQTLDWNRPHALFRQASLNDGIEYLPVIGQPWALSLIEDWRP